MNSKATIDLLRYPSVERIFTMWEVPIRYFLIESFYNVENNKRLEDKIKKKMKLNSLILEVIAAKTLDNRTRANPDCQ